MIEENDRLEETVKAQQTQINFQRETIKKHKGTIMALNDTRNTIAQN